MLHFPLKKFIMVSLNERRNSVDEQKKTRLAAAMTVNVILLVVILAVVIIYQLAVIVSVNKKSAEIKSEIERYEQLIENGNKDLDYLKSEQYLLDYAMQQLGYIFPPKN